MTSSEQHIDQHTFLLHWESMMDDLPHPIFLFRGEAVPDPGAPVAQNRAARQLCQQLIRWKLLEIPDELWSYLDLASLLAQSRLSGQDSRGIFSYREGAEEQRWHQITLRQVSYGILVTLEPVQADIIIQIARKGLDHSPDGVIVYEAIRDVAGTIMDYRIAFCNERVYSLFGYTKELLSRSTLFQLYPPARMEAENFRRVVETGVPMQAEHFYPGLNTWFQVRNTRLGDGFLCTLRDITQTKDLQRTNEEQRRLLLTILESLPTSVIVFQPVRDPAGQTTDWKIRLINQSAAHRLGLQSGRTTRELGADFQHEVASLLDKLPASGQPLDLDCYLSSLSASPGWFEVHARSLDDGIVVNFTEITARKQMQDRLERLVEELQRSNESLARFAAVASHDLQEPLRKIQAFSQLLRQQYTESLPLTAQDLMIRMSGAADRMSLLIRDLLTYSRLNGLRPNLQRVDLNVLLREILGDLEITIQDKQARIDITPLPTIPGDPLQLRQLFQNLLSNALKFVRPGVPVSVRIAAHPTRLPATDQPGVAIAIADNGIGFKPADASQIFELFRRLHGRTTYQGTGIGLAICRQVVENHGGTIRAEGRPGEGATFTVYLPESHPGSVLLP